MWRSLSFTQPPQVGLESVYLSSSHLSMCTLSLSSVACHKLIPTNSHNRPALDTSMPTSKARGVSVPQCCHCGWRGAHAPGCPFK
ncbi:hypothetical protein IW261DRAFT_1518906 [Armillaria novae-zelandiae]|uniref:Uncharacterized protein n=1 Tax=Armillaria novae-zelandiae TaxID=153914 RepID=A0AA39U5T8_9AGAR|nr:hypothetical protein IW261DRAFT_1518906 [Armillaria novae-zelandiae]